MPEQRTLIRWAFGLILIGSLVVMVVSGGSGNTLIAGLIAGFWLLFFTLVGLAVMADGGRGF
jgi:hypothetical protein